jgi:archaemetzincin
MDHFLKNRMIIVAIALLAIAACETKYAEHTSKQKKPMVLLQPLQFHDANTLRFLADSIEKFYPVEMIIAHSKEFPAHAYYKPRNRYRADSTIKWLLQVKPDSVRTIVGITNEDVSVDKGPHLDYGVMGLGYKPGKACVVSTFRIRKTARSNNHLRQRLFKLVVHEMGHNFGLDHCPDETCIMADAEGQMKLDQEKDFCMSCKQRVRI